MNRQTFATLFQAWMRSRGLALAECVETSLGNTPAPADAIVPLSESAVAEALLEFTCVLDDASLTGATIPRPRVPPEARTVTTRISPEVLEAALSASRVG